MDSCCRPWPDDVDDVIVARSIEAGADALDIAAHGCAAVLVAHPTMTTKTQLQGGADQLGQIGAVVIGTVLADTAAPTPGTSASGASAEAGPGREPSVPRPERIGTR